MRKWKSVIKAWYNTQKNMIADKVMNLKNYKPTSNLLIGKQIEKIKVCFFIMKHIKLQTWHCFLELKKTVVREGRSSRGGQNRKGEEKISFYL